jgi:uncharacterized protein
MAPSLRPLSRRRRALRAGAVVIALAAVVAVAMASPALADPGDGTRTTSERRTITATGTARVHGTPDVLSVTLGVSSPGDTVGEALSRNNAAANKVLEVLRDGGVDERDIQTTNFSIGPWYGDNGDVEHYRVSNLVVADLRDLGKAGNLIDRAAQAGGDDVVVRHVAFDFDDTSNLIAAARSDAVKRARTQATQLADAAGVPLGEVVRISETSPDVGPVLEQSAADALASRAAGEASVPIQPGSEELWVRVSIVFAIG